LNLLNLPSPQAQILLIIRKWRVNTTQKKLQASCTFQAVDDKFWA